MPAPRFRGFSTDAKKSRASATVISSTSWMERPRQVSFSTSSRYRLPLADLAVQTHVVEERQLDSQEAPALACRTGTPGVEAEERRRHPVGGGERPPDGVEHADVGGGIGTGRTSDGALIDRDHLAASSVPGRPAPEGVDELRHQRALARPGHAGDARQDALRYADGEVAQVVGRRVLDAERVVERPAAAARRGDPVVQGARCRGVGAQQAVETSGEDHLAAVVAGAGADIDDPVRRADDRRVVLDDEHRVAVIPQAVEHGDEVIDVPRMEPHGRLVQDVDEIDEVAVELPGHLHPLALAAGQRRHAAVERQVADADVDKVPERPAHPGDQRPDDVADRFVVVPREEFLEHAVQLRQLALDQPADGPAARELHRARRGVEPERRRNRGTPAP